MSDRRRKSLAGEIRSLLRERAGRPLKPKEIARELDVHGSEYRELKSLLREMAAAGELYQVKRGRYAPPDKINLVTGRFATARHGGGTVTAERSESGDGATANPVVFVTGSEVGGAMHGDRVVARLSGRNTGPLPNAEVIKVLERARKEIVGTIHIERGVAFVDPEDPKVGRDVLVPIESIGDAEEGQLVVAKIVSWGDRRGRLVGEVTEVLGDPGDPGLDVLVVMKDYGLPHRFPEGVEAAAERVRRSPVPPGRRRDLTKLETFTIDPVDAKDFDDALSIREVEGGLFEVGVHIADVGHYVRPGDTVDREAYARATSVYLVDRVVPMLPEALSNDLCSLVPEADRLAFSVLMRVDPGGKVRSAMFTPSTIHSRRRFAYHEVQELLDGKAPAPRDREFVRPLRRLHALSEALIAARHGRGSLDFDLPESRVILDAEGFPVDIQKIERLAAHRLVESFMLLANECVAKKLRTVGWPALYRVHEGPDPMAAEELRDTLSRLGLRLPVSKNRPLTPRMLQAVLAEVAGEPHEALVNTLVLRSMKRAIYHAEPSGHFGLATKNYCHFTSPIRRYPDLVVHRILRAVGERGKPPVEDSARMARMAEHCSERERIAQEAERASVELKKVQLMGEHIGEVFEGRIAGVTSFGFFVELDSFHVQGLVHLNRLEDDYYAFDERRLALVGERTARTFRMGDRVEVEVARTDIVRRQIDFELVSWTPRDRAYRSPR